MLAGCASGKIAHDALETAVVGWQSIVSTPATIDVPSTRKQAPRQLVIENDSSYREQLRPYWFAMTMRDLSTMKPYSEKMRIGSADAKLEVAIVDLTGDGVEDLVLRVRAGPYFEELIVVYVWTETHLGGVFVQNLGWRPNDGPPWYSVDFVDTDGDGIKDVLVVPLRGGPPISPTNEAYLYPPKLDRIVYRYNPISGRIELAGPPAD